MRARVTLEGKTPNRKFEFQVKAIATDDEGVILDDHVKWWVKNPATGQQVLRTVKYRTLEERLAVQADEAAQDQDFTLAIAESRTGAAERAQDMREDR